MVERKFGERKERFVKIGPFSMRRQDREAITKVAHMLIGEFAGPEAKTMVEVALVNACKRTPSSGSTARIGWYGDLVLFSDVLRALVKRMK